MVSFTAHNLSPKEAKPKPSILEGINAIAKETYKRHGVRDIGSGPFITILEFSVNGGAAVLKTKKEDRALEPKQLTALLDYIQVQREKLKAVDVSPTNPEAPHTIYIICEPNPKKIKVKLAEFLKKCIFEPAPVIASVTRAIVIPRTHDSIGNHVQKMAATHRIGNGSFAPIISQSDYLNHGHGTIAVPRQKRHSNDKPIPYNLSIPEDKYGQEGSLFAWLEDAHIAHETNAANRKIFKIQGTENLIGILFPMNCVPLAVLTKVADIEKHVTFAYSQELRGCLAIFPVDADGPGFEIAGKEMNAVMPTLSDVNRDRCKIDIDTHSLTKLGLHNLIFDTDLRIRKKTAPDKRQINRGRAAPKELSPTELLEPIIGVQKYLLEYLEMAVAGTLAGIENSRNATHANCLRIDRFAWKRCVLLRLSAEERKHLRPEDFDSLLKTSIALRQHIVRAHRYKRLDISVHRKGGREDADNYILTSRVDLPTFDRRLRSLRGDSGIEELLKLKSVEKPTDGKTTVEAA